MPAGINAKTNRIPEKDFAIIAVRGANCDFVNKYLFLLSYPVEMPAPGSRNECKLFFRACAPCSIPAERAKILTGYLEKSRKVL
jgi:hypothetical protein